MLFGHDYDVEDAWVLPPAPVINATRPGGGGQTGTFQLGRVDRIDSVSIELSHAGRGDIAHFTLTAPNGNVFSFMSSADYFLSGVGVVNNPGNDLGNGGFDLLGLSIYEFTESASSTIASVTTNPTPAGAYQARTWHSAPTGGWAPGTWAFELGGAVGTGQRGAVGRIEVHGVPEPSAFALLAGLVAFAGVALRRRVR